MQDLQLLNLSRGYTARKSLPYLEVLQKDNSLTTCGCIPVATQSNRGESYTFFKFSYKCRSIYEKSVAKNIVQLCDGRLFTEYNHVCITSSIHTINIHITLCKIRNVVHVCISIIIILFSKWKLQQCGQGICQVATFIVHVGKR